MRDNARSAGISDAFIVAIFGGSRTTIANATSILGGGSPVQSSSNSNPAAAPEQNFATKSMKYLYTLNLNLYRVVM